MRVIAGSSKGIRLYSIEGKKTRPIQDRTKESLFNIISSIIPHSCVMDMYAGTGAIGIEALSRGAEYCLFVENNRSAIAVIRKNLEVTRLQHRAHVLKIDVFNIIPYLERNRTLFDVIFVAPPYFLAEESAYRDKLLVMFSRFYEKHFIKPKGLIILQHRKADIHIPRRADYLELSLSRVYGDTQFSFFKSSMSSRQSSRPLQ